MNTNQQLAPSKTGASLAPFEPTNIIEALKLSETLAGSALVPKALQGRPSDILVVLMKARELGMPPIAALGQIHVIDGKAVMSSDAIQGVILRSGVLDYFTLVESTNEHATYRAKRKDSPHEVVLSFTMDDARAAGLLGKDNWRKYPAAMLRARAAADTGREVAPDVMAGLYDMDEADDIRGGARAAEVVDDGRQPRPTTIEGLKAMHRESLASGVAALPAAPPGRPQDRGARPVTPESLPDPIAQAAQAQPQPAPEPQPITVAVPQSPADWYDPSKGGFDPSDPSDLDLELAGLPSTPFGEWIDGAPWKSTTKLGQWKPRDVICGSEGGGRAALLQAAVDYARNMQNPPEGARIADYCLALMRKRWKLQETAAQAQAQATSASDSSDNPF